MSIRCLLIFREITNFPNRENDDAFILKGVADELVKFGKRVHFIEPEVIDDIIDEKWDCVVPKCENSENLEKIKKMNFILINPVESVYNCYRRNMFLLVMKHCPEVFPKSEMMDMKDFPGNPPSFLNSHGSWVKRGDVHNTCLHDVHYVKKRDDAVRVKEDFEKRNIKDVLI